MYYILRLLETLLFIKVAIGHAQHSDDIEILFKDARGASYKLSPNGKSLKKRKTL